MPSKYMERRSIRNKLESNLGWTGINYREGFLKDAEIVVPCVSVFFLPSNFKALQMGHDSTNSVTRIVQIDCYMESEPRADAISEAIATYIEANPISIKDQNENEVGVLSSDTESITWQTVPPILTNPKIIRWRSIIRATFHAYYYE